MTLLGQLVAFTNSSISLTAHLSRDWLPSVSRQRSYSVFWHAGRRVCKKTFLFLHTISDKRLRNLQRGMRENGLAPRRHGNLHRLPPNAISFTDTQRVVEFLHSYSEANAILLPGRIPGYKQTDDQLLPSSTTKHLAEVLCSIRKQYQPAGCVFNLLQHLEVCGPTHHSHQANERSLLGLSDQQHGHHEVCKSA